MQFGNRKQNHKNQKNLVETEDSGVEKKGMLLFRKVDIIFGVICFEKLVLSLIKRQREKITYIKLAGDSFYVLFLVQIRKVTQKKKQREERSDF